MTRNIVLLTVDSLRADYGDAGDEGSLAPAIDRLAEEGIVFEHAIAPGARTPSSMPVSHTGRFVVPPDTWDWEARYRRVRDHLRQHRTVAERIRERGYTTVGVTANPWTHGTGFDRGFDEFVALTPENMESPGPVFGLLDRVMRVGGLGDRLNWPSKRQWFIDWRQQYAQIRSALERAREREPYFLWLFLLDTHRPYIARRQYRSESSALATYYATLKETHRHEGRPSPRTVSRLRRAYRDTIRSVDRFVERFRDDLDGDDPLFVLHSDHGEAFGEHGTYGHQRQLYEENIRVPLIVHGAQSGRVPAPFSLRRLPSLLCAFADEATVSPERFIDPVVAATVEDGSKWTLRGRRWKYIRGDDGERLYDLECDPGERTDRSSDAPAVLALFRRQLLAQRTDQCERGSLLRSVANVEGEL